MPREIQSTSPTDGSVVYTTTAADESQVGAAIEFAGSAQRDWAARTFAERVAIAHRYAELLKRDREEVACGITDEIGKLPSDALGEVNASIAKVAVTLDAIESRWHREPFTHRETFTASVMHRPIGVIVVLGPNNFPLHLPGGQIIPALLAGNSVVFKPGEAAPGVAAKMKSLWDEAGLPEGLLSVIPGGVDVATQAISNPNIHGVFLTGGIVAGRAVHQALAGRPEVLLAMELGGNNPLVWYDKELPMEIPQSIEVIHQSAFVSAGQRCTCARRLMVVESSTSQNLIDHLVDRVKKTTVGLPGDTPEPEIGPMIDNASADKILAAQDKLVAMGGKLLVACERSSRCNALVSPGLMDMTETNTGEGFDEEFFGPLLQIRRVPDFDEALVSCQTRFGLSAGLIGGSAADFDRFCQQVHAGVINHNTSITGASGKLPFGGVGLSGNHRPAGYHAIDACGDPVAILRPSRSH